MPSSREYSENDANYLLKKDEVDGEDLGGLLLIRVSIVL